MEYENIAKSVITSAVKTHLRTELKVHCSRVAQAKATAWLKKNRKAIEESLGKEIEKKLDKELPRVVKTAAKNVTVHAPVKRHCYS